jgi:serine/threonine-protein kinase
MSAIPTRLLELSPEDRLRVEAWLVEFEVAWDEGRLAAQVARLPPPGQPLRLPALVELVKIDLERQWQCGRRPRAGDYVLRYPELGSAGAPPADLLRAEEEAASQFGDAPGTLPAAPTVPQAGPPRPAGKGTAVPGYEIGEELGRGGMGLVVKGHHRHMDRDVAVKLLLKEYQGQPHLVRRFLDEARIHGRLQHPGIVPLYELGELPSGSPYFTMKVVQGRTLAALLRERTEPARDLPHFLTIFEQVCQAVAYAHSQGVIHRDLKPSNVMVGKFGEVQVMDWGLAKVLDRDAGSQADGAPAGGPGRNGPPAPAASMPTRSGEAMGTVPYMPPEQARGEVERMDQRCDVFGLGAMLCEILTGEPPLQGGNTTELLARARACDHTEALARLDGCGADAALVRLAKACLAAEPADRPNDAGVVTAAVKDYLEGVRERLRAAELERAEAKARAEEAKATAAAERKARRRTAGLALAVLLLVAGGGSGAWLWLQEFQERAQRQQETGATVRQAIAEVLVLREQARAAPPSDPERFRVPLVAAGKARDMARPGEVSDDVLRQATELAAQLGQEDEAARRDWQLLVALLNVRGPREGPKYQKDDKGFMAQMAEPSADEQFAAAFRAWGLDVDRVPTAEAAARLARRPAAVVMEVIAALDEWAGERRRQGQPPAAGKRLSDLADALDEEGSRRAELRELLARGALERERLRQLAEQVNATTEPVLGVLALARAFRAADDDAGAVRLLQKAVQARPQEVVLHDALGKLLEQQRPPRWHDAAQQYQSVRVLRGPGHGESQAYALIKGGHVQDGLDLYQQLVTEKGDNPWLRLRYGNALCAQGRYEDAAEQYEQVIRLQPNSAAAHNNYGVTLAEQGHYEDAVDEYRKALDIDERFAEAHTNLGNALLARGPDKAPEAEAAYKKAVSCKPNSAEAHYNLGTLLLKQNKHPKAAECFRTALHIDKAFAAAHNNLGMALLDQGQAKEAEAPFRDAITSKRDFPEAHYNLGKSLLAQGQAREAEASFRDAITLKKDYPEAHYNLGEALMAQGRFAAAEVAYRRAIDFKPDFLAHNGLGTALMAQHKYEDAEAAFGKAITRKSGWPIAHFNRGNALRNLKKYPEAEGEYRIALHLQRNFPSALWNLGLTLDDLGRSAEALDCFEEAHKRGSNAWRRFYGTGPRLEVSRRLLDVRRGDVEPAGAAAVALARFARSPEKRLYAVAVRLYAAAFAHDPKLAEDMHSQHRYDAACSAVLAAGQGEPGRPLPDKVAPALRRQALDWLSAELRLYGSLDPAANSRVRQWLAHWQRDRDLASVRDKEELAKLPDDERRRWRKLWEDVEVLLKQVEERE